MVVSPQPRFRPPVNYVFYRGRGRVQAKFRTPGPGRGRVQYFFNTGAGAGPGLTKFTYTGAGAGFVEKYRGLTGAGAVAVAPFGSYLQCLYKCCNAQLKKHKRGKLFALLIHIILNDVHFCFECAR